MAHLVGAILARQGHQVETVATVETTVARLTRELDLDAVLLDVNMPDGTARDALRRLEGHPLPPIVLLTGTRSDDLEDLLHDPRVHGFVSKPVTPDALAEALARVLGAPEAP